MNIQQYWSTDLTLLTAHFGVHVTRQLNRCSMWNRNNNALFSDHYLRNRSTLDIGVLSYIGIVWPKERSPEVWHIPPGTPCIKSILWKVVKHLSYIEEARCLKVNMITTHLQDIVWWKQACASYEIYGYRWSLHQWQNSKLKHDRL